MAAFKGTVLITGCSDGGLGSALAVAFHKTGWHVIATARNPNKMSSVASLGITTLTLDVLDQASIESCVAQVNDTNINPSGVLDILVNNAGSTYLMPLADISLKLARELYDLNVWSYIAVTQAFLPTLRQSIRPGGAVVVNQTSMAAGIPIPWQGVYNSSKAALAMLTDTLRLELEPFNIKVVELRTALVKSNFIKSATTSTQEVSKIKLPAESLYTPAKETLEERMKAEEYEDKGAEASVWAEGVACDLTKSDNKVPRDIWRGNMVLLGLLGRLLPAWVLDMMLRRGAKVDVITKIMNDQKKTI